MPDRRPGAGTLLLGLGLLGVLVVCVTEYNSPLYSAAYLLVSLGASAAAWVGAVRFRGPARPGMVLIAVGLTASSIGDVAYTAYYEVVGREPDLSVADAFWMIGYGALAAALFVIEVRVRRRRGVDSDAVIDGLTVATVCLLVFWMFFVEDIVAGESVSLLVRTTWASYPLFDAVLLALVVRALTDRRVRGVIGLPLALGISCWLVSDVGSLFEPASRAARAGLDVGWLLGPMLMATAAWRAPRTEPVPDDRGSRHPRRQLAGRLAIAIVPLLVPPALDGLRHLRGEHAVSVAPFVAFVVLLGLTLARLVRLTSSEEDAYQYVESNRRYYTRLAASSSDAVLVVDRGGAPLRRVSGLVALDDASDLEIHEWFRALTSAEDPRLREVWDEVLLAPGQTVTTEVEVEDPDGHPMWFSCRMTNLLEYPDVRGVVIAVSDITDRKAVEVELERTRDAAVAGSRAKSAFLATMSHEIRTPMNGVIGLTELLLGTDLDDRQRQYATGVRSAGEGLLAIINDILDFSKVEAGHLQLEAIDFDLAALLQETTALVEPAARGKGVTLVSSCASDLPTLVRGDPGRLRQVLLNLASNAVKFTDHGGVVVAASLAALGEDRVEACFEVSDTGIGIAEGERDQLFEAFSQADSSTTRRFGGTGLGLAITRHLVTAMGGEGVLLDSALGSGSRFWFTLPFERAATAPADLPGPGPGGAVPVGAATRDDDRGRAPGHRGHRGHVLIAEDSEINQLVATGILEHLGFTAEVAGNGEEALAAIGRRDFDAVLMDCQMPVLDGYDTTRELRRRQATARRTPVIAMTAGALDGDRERCLAAGMDDYVAKPVTPAALEAALARWVSPRPVEPV